LLKKFRTLQRRNTYCWNKLQYKILRYSGAVVRGKKPSWWPL